MRDCAGRLKNVLGVVAGNLSHRVEQENIQISLITQMLKYFECKVAKICILKTRKIIKAYHEINRVSPSELKS